MSSHLSSYQAHAADDVVSVYASAVRHDDFDIPDAATNADINVESENQIKSLIKQVNKAAAKLIGKVATKNDDNFLSLKIDNAAIELERRKRASEDKQLKKDVKMSKAKSSAIDSSSSSAIDSSSSSSSQSSPSTHNPVMFIGTMKNAPAVSKTSYDNAVALQNAARASSSAAKQKEMPRSIFVADA